MSMLPDILSLPFFALNEISPASLFLENANNPDVYPGLYLYCVSTLISLKFSNGEYTWAETLLSSH